MELKPPTNLKLHSLFDGISYILKWDAGDVDSYNIYISDSPEGLNRKKIGYNYTISQFQYCKPEVLATMTQYLTVTSVKGDEESEHSEPVSTIDGYEQITDFVNLNHVLPEIMRRRGILLKIGGENCIYLIRKNSGERCQCFSQERGYSDPLCRCCYGTGFVGGYDQVFGRFRKYSNETNITISEEGFIKNNTPRAWNLIWPFLNSGDLIVRNTGEFFRVQDVTLGTTNGVITRQTFSLQEVMRDEPIVKFPIRKSLWDTVSTSVIPSAYYSTKFVPETDITLNSEDL